MIGIQESNRTKDILFRYEKIQRIINPGRFLPENSSAILQRFSLEPIIEEAEEQEGEILSEAREEAIRKNKEIIKS